MSAKKLMNAFERWAAQGRPLVLASVFETEGSTYSKAGAQMLITGDGLFQGMLSGGCLEGDLAERAVAVIDSGKAQVVTYDLGQNDEELWGLGVGCDGLMRIFLQALVEENDYEPFATMTRSFGGDSDQIAVTILESSVESLPAGSAMVTVDGEIDWTDIDERFFAALGQWESQSTYKSTCQLISVDGHDVKLLKSLLQAPPSILVLGAGLDAEPVVRLADELGWRVTISDHRPAYIEAGDFATAEQIKCVPAAEIASELNCDRFSAAIVMSHHLATDRTYLDQLAVSSIPYIGLLGPRDRRKRLLDDLADQAVTLQGRIHGPAGLDIGARGPAPIALAIIAEMHQFLMRDEDQLSMPRPDLQAGIRE